MRLLDSTTLDFCQFLNERELPPYAILSHRWGQDKVSYEDVLKRGLRDRQLGESEGCDKILRCARQTRHDGLKYFWIDTCMFTYSWTSREYWGLLIGIDWAVSKRRVARSYLKLSILCTIQHIVLFRVWYDINRQQGCRWYEAQLCATPTL
jgi:hypothetical protein